MFFISFKKLFSLPAAQATLFRNNTQLLNQNNEQINLLSASLMALQYFAERVIAQCAWWESPNSLKITAWRILDIVKKLSPPKKEF